MSEGSELKRLSRQQTGRRDALETVIEDARRAFIEAGKALAEIRDQRLYRETHATFADYLQERWGFTEAHGYRLIDAAQVAEAVSPIGEIANEAQARELVPVLRTGGASAVLEVVQSLGEEPLTAAKLKAARELREGPPAPGPRRRRGRLPWRVLKEVTATQRLKPSKQGLPDLRVSVDPADDLREWVRGFAEQQDIASEDSRQVLLDLPQASRELIEAVKLGRWEQPEVRDFACLLARTLLAEGARAPRLRRESREETTMPTST